tara:strand:- start:182 stop:724 length:543 start_codon:yes stop_codon:yes gene_type:complete
LLEISESKKENTYCGSLTEFYESIQRLTEQLHQQNIGFESGSSYICDYRIKLNPVHNDAPPDIYEFLVILWNSGLVITLYKLLQLWIKEKNGRKIKIKIDNFEVEATQLNEKQFLKLFKNIREYKKQNAEAFHRNSAIDPSIKKDLLKELKKEGCQLSQIDSKKHLLEIRKLSRAILKKK